MNDPVCGQIKAWTTYGSIFAFDKVIPGDARHAVAYATRRADLIEAIIEAGKEGAFAADVPATWVASAFDSLIYAAWEAVIKGELTPAQAADLAWRTLTRGLGGDAG